MYSSLVSKRIPSPNYSDRTVDIDSIAIQCCCSDMSLSGMGEIYSQEGNQSSAHYGIDKDGKIASFVDEEKMAWSISNKAINNRCISVMLASTTSQNPYPCSQKSYDSLILLLADICVRNKIVSLKWKDNQEYALKAAAGSPVKNQNIFIHKWFKKVKDPGEWLHGKINDIVDDVNTALISYQNTYRRILFIGDSRAAQIKSAVVADQNIWATSGDSTFTLSKRKEEIISTQMKPGYALCIFGSVLDVSQISAKKFAKFINSSAEEWIPKGSPVYYISINPVGADGYKKITNADIKKYNKTIKNNLIDGVGYIDTYNAILQTYKLKSDDYSFDSDTNKSIYSTIIAQASRMYSGVPLCEDLNLDPVDFNPYIVMFNRDHNPTYSKLSNNRVSGAIIEAGYRYSRSHVRTSKFDNPNIEDQIKQLDKYKIPYGMYTVCRAQNAEEAHDEIKYFRYQLYRHPPKLGAWLVLELDNTKGKNNNLLRIYKEDLAELGLSGSSGIICTRGFLEKFTWKDFQDSFYLYLVDHIKDLTDVDELLDPKLFDTDDTLESDIYTIPLTSNTTTNTTMTDDTVTTTTTTVSTIRKEIVNYAKKYIGTKYVWGATSTKPGEPTDCGGLICAVYKHFGMDLYRNRTDIVNSYGKIVSFQNAKPGDVMHYPHHVALYIGNNELIEAANENVGVRQHSVYSGYDKICNIIDYWNK